MYDDHPRSNSPRTILVIIAAILIFLWYNDTKNPDVRIVSPTPQPYVVPTTAYIQPAQPVFQPTSDPYIQVTVDAYYAEQQNQTLMNAFSDQSVTPQPGSLNEALGNDGDINPFRGDLVVQPED